MSTIDYRDPSLLATISSNGLMSSDDKNKLNGIGPIIDGYASTAALQSETNRATAAEAQIRVLIDGYASKTSLSAEVSRSTIADNQIKAALDGYTTKTYVDGYAASIKASVTAEANRAMAAEYQIRQALDGYSGSSATDGYATKAYVDGYAASIKALISVETNRAIAEENIIKVALDGYVMTYGGEPFSIIQATGGIGISVFEGVATLTAEDVETLVQNEANRAIAEENIIKIALDGYSGGGGSTDGYATKAYVDGYAAAIQASVTAETNRAVAEENIIKSALDGYGGSSSGVVQTIRFAIGTGATQNSASSIPATAVVQDCVVRIDTPYSPGTTISVGRSGSAALVQATTDNDPTIAGLYQAPQDTLWGVLGQVQVTVGGSPGAGAGYCSVNYVVANA